MIVFRTARVLPAVVALLTVVSAGCGPGQETPDDTTTAAASMVHDPDTRTVVMLPVQGRHMVLEEMRLMLGSVHGFVTAASQGDTAGMRAAAEASGIAAARDMDPAMARRLPPEFEQLGMATHAAWDSLAADIKGGAPVDRALGRLGTLMSSCVACHTQFRIETGP